MGTSHSDIVKEDVSLEYITMSQRFKSPCEAHGMVRWGSPKTPSQIKRQEDVNQAGRQIAKILIVV